MKIHTTIGVYPNGDYKINGVSSEHLESHIEYNRSYRPGRALFLDGKCIYNGSLSKEEISKFEKLFSDSRFTMKNCTVPYV